jgi:hypothetical protein
MFLAPSPGAIHILADGQGMERRQRCVEQGAMKRVIEEEICCFEPASEDSPPMTIDIPGHTVLPTPNEPWSITDRYTLYVDGTRLLRTTSWGEVTLFDSARTTWKDPMISSTGMPKEGTCRIVSKKWMPYRGADRLIVVVEFKGYLNGEMVHAETWTLASGLGIVAMDDFVLTSVEQTGAPPQGQE